MGGGFTDLHRWLNPLRWAVVAERSGKGMENLQSGADTLFVLLGAILVLWMHAGFAFLEVGTVRGKNQVNALVKIFCDLGISTIAYFFVGYSIACLLYTSPSPRDRTRSRMPSSA